MTAAGTNDAARVIMVDPVESEPLWRTFVGAFRGLVWWQKATIVVLAVMTAPFSLWVVLGCALMLAPFWIPVVLTGRWEGTGNQSFVHEVDLRVHEVRAHNEAFYARP